jgi:hypothetical protein
MPAGLSAYTALANVTLGSSASSVTFSSISQVYRDLVLVYVPIGSTATGTNILFNGDTGSNYNMVWMSGNGSSGSSSSISNNGAFIGSSFSEIRTTSGTQIIFNVMDYSATDKHKTMLFRMDRADSATQAFATRWASTSAVTSISLTPGSGTFVAGTTLALYGVSA